MLCVDKARTDLLAHPQTLLFEVPRAFTFGISEAGEAKAQDRLCLDFVHERDQSTAWPVSQETRTDDLVLTHVNHQPFQHSVGRKAINI